MRRATLSQTGLRLVLGVCTAMPASFTSGCGPTEIADGRRQLLQSWGDTFLLPAYAELEEQTERLASDSSALCLKPSAARLSSARDTWRSARAVWKATEVFSFGPVKEFPKRLGAQIDFWPVRVGSLEAAIETRAFDDAAALGAAEKGFPAVEWLLFRQEALARFRQQPAGCDYLVVLADELSLSVTALREAWDPKGEDYLSELTQAGRESESFESLQVALGEVVNRMGFLLENIRDSKLGKPLGGDDGPQPDKAESQFSGASLDDVQSNLDGIERLYFGGEKASELGLRDYLKRSGANFDDQLSQRLSRVRSGIAKVKLPLTEAITQEPDRIEALSARLGELQRLVQIDVVNALSLTLRFNENDGD